MLVQAATPVEQLAPKDVEAYEVAMLDDPNAENAFEVRGPEIPAPKTFRNN